MKGTVLAGYSVNLKNAVGVTVGTLKPGDVVYGDVNSLSGRSKIYFSKIYRSAGSIEDFSPNICNANTDNDAEPLIRWINVTNESEPGTTPQPSSGQHSVVADYNDDGTIKEVFVDGTKVYPI